MKLEGEKDYPDVFISYSWDNDDHKAWVKGLANSLLNDGINAILDQYDLTPGGRLPLDTKACRIDSIVHRFYYQLCLLWKFA